MTSTGQDNPAIVFDAPARQFILWCLEAVGVRATIRERGVYLIDPPNETGDDLPAGEHPHAELAGRRFSFERPAQDASASSIEHVTWKSPLVRWLLAELRGKSWPIHAAAAHQPISVHELTEHLFAQYQVEDGHVSLAGCSLEDRPFLRLSFFNPRVQAGQAQVVHCFGASDGSLLDDELRARLELDELVPATGRPPRFEEDVLKRWTDVTSRHCEAASDARASSLIAATLVWCKHAEGKLAFSIGRKSVEVPFSGWGRLFVDRSLLPPPFTCPASGRSSYHLTATDDGRITVADAVAVCAASSRRVLTSELETCAATGHHVLPEFLRTCPVTGDRVLVTALQSCSMCRQEVSSKSLLNQRCQACRNVEVASKTDSRIARILDAYPKLDRWRNWKIAQTQSVGILIGSSTWKRLLLVVDKHSLDVLRVASSGRFSSGWTDVTDAQRRDILS